MSSPLEWISALLLLAAVFGNTQNRVWAWPVGIVGLALTLPVYVQVRLYADLGLTAVYILLGFYGWWIWMRGGAGAKPKPITKASTAEQLLLVALSLGCAAGMGYALQTYTDADLPYVDSATTAFSLAAQYLLARRKLQNWTWWIGIDVVYVGVYAYKEIPFFAGLYALYTVLAVWGWWKWKKLWQA